MKSSKDVIQHIAPTLASALDGPFASVAVRYIRQRLDDENTVTPASESEDLLHLLDDPANLQCIRELDETFKQEMKALGVDVFALQRSSQNTNLHIEKTKHKAQIWISVMFLFTYFLMLVAIFVVEMSDSLNMKQGDNSIMGELQILFGVLTAGVGQILSFWFGGVLGKGSASSPD